jgi:transcriptional regulator with XRE-family HTH domain
MINENDKEIIRRFGAHLSKLRDEKGLSQRQLSHRCRVDYSKIGAMERGEVNVTLITLTEIAKGLGVNVNELLKFEID